MRTAPLTHSAVPRPSAKLLGLRCFGALKVLFGNAWKPSLRARHRLLVMNGEQSDDHVWGKFWFQRTRKVPKLRSVARPASLPTQVRALQSVTLDVVDGPAVIVIDTTDSEKSTLLNARTFRLDHGTIALSGHDVAKWPEHRRAAMIGRVFQNPFSGTAPNMTVAENLALAARRGLSRGLGNLLPAKLHAELRDRVATLNMQLETLITPSARSPAANAKPSHY